MQFIIKIFIFKQSNFCIDIDVKNKNCSSLLYFFFFESTYYLDNFIRYLINVCIDVKELINIILKTTFAFQISCDLNIDSSRFKQNSFNIKLILLSLRYFL